MFKFIPFLVSSLSVLINSDGVAMDNIDSATIPKVSFIFVRHGHTPWGPGDITLGPQNLELDQVGKEQAKQAAEYLASNFDRPLIVISSPLIRARQTAEEVREYTHPNQFLLFEVLKERYYGDYRLVESKSEVPPDAELPAAFHDRVINVFEQILSQYNDPRYEVVIVSHQKVFEELTKSLVGTSSKLDQGGIGYFIQDERGHWKVAIPSLRK
jgi:broad specificity phosphatase PhoE